MTGGSVAPSNSQARDAARSGWLFGFPALVYIAWRKYPDHWVLPHLRSALKAWGVALTAYPIGLLLDVSVNGGFSEWEPSLTFLVVIGIAGAGLAVRIAVGLGALRSAPK